MPTYISLGPTCIAATLLRDSNLRNQTFGFDWSRSGSLHIADFFSMPLEHFLYKHAYYPNVQLAQSEEPSVANLHTPPIQPREILYGFNYLLNPHRDYNIPETREYIRRSFNRLYNVVHGEQGELVFMLADYENKPYYSYLSNYSAIASFIESVVPRTVQCWRLLIIRIRLVEDTFMIGIRVNSSPISQKCHLLTVLIPPILDQENYCSFTYRCIMQRIHHASGQ